MRELDAPPAPGDPTAHARTSSHLTYRDHFSRQAAAYAAYRPDYPEALFAYVAGLATRHELAWDCATGSGQAALGLVPYFARVVATDASAAQIAHATTHARVEYRLAPAEASGLPDGAVDLITVAQALHWFDVGAFYAEARRVLAPSGVVAVWTYGNCVFDDPVVERAVHRYSHDTVGPYWPAERRLVDDGYQTIPFPFREVAPPSFVLERAWTLAELAGYLRTWSATARYVGAHGRDPVTDVEAELRRAGWGDPDARRTVRWPLTLRAGSRE